MIKKNFKNFCSALVFSMLCIVICFSNALANENSSTSNSAQAHNTATAETIQNKEASSQEVAIPTDFRADFIFQLQGPKSSVQVRPFNPELLLRDVGRADDRRDDRRDGGRDDRRDDRRDNNRDRNSEQENLTNAQIIERITNSIAFEYAFKTPYFFTNEQELMLDVVELADLYEPNLVVTFKDEVLTLQYTNETEKVVAQENAEANKTNAPIEKEFNKEVYVLTIDLDEDEKEGLLSHTIYMPVVIEETGSKEEKLEPEFTAVDEAKSFIDKAVVLNAPVEIIENYLFVPLSLVTFFNETVVKDETSFIASSNFADKENVRKLSQIKNVTQEIEKAPDFLSRENFELIYAMIGPAGTFIVFLAFVAIYLALKNLYYLTFVWMQFIRKYKHQENECVMLDPSVESKNPLIQMIREVSSLRIKDPTALRTEVSFLFNRNFEMVAQDLSYIRLISVISPLLGLLGTVLGMVDVFQAIAESASPDPADLAAGIFTALQTTILGLTVAVPTLIVYYYLLLKYKRYLGRMIKFTIHIRNVCPE